MCVLMTKKELAEFDAYLKKNMKAAQVIHIADLDRQLVHAEIVGKSGYKDYHEFRVKQQRKAA